MITIITCNGITELNLKCTIDLGILGYAGRNPLEYFFFYLFIIRYLKKKNLYSSSVAEKSALLRRGFRTMYMSVFMRT